MGIFRICIQNIASQYFQIARAVRVVARAPLRSWEFFVSGDTVEETPETHKNPPDLKEAGVFSLLRGAQHNHAARYYNDPGRHMRRIRVYRHGTGEYPG
jgi:hypothetical protein